MACTNRFRHLEFWRTLVLGFFLLPVSLSSVAGQDQLPEGEMIHWHSYYPDALEEARQTGKPIFLEFRCAPCVNGRHFDAQVVYTPRSSRRGELLSRYVCARITSMTGVNIAHFERDWHNSLYYFVINADEEIYLRYGGRDERAADSYLNLKSLELALEAGLSEHQNREKEKKAGRTARPPEVTLLPSDYPLLKTNIIETGRCTECHLIADYSMQEKDFAGLLDPLEDLYRSPDIKRLGLHLDVPRGLLLESATGVAADAGIQAGDTINAFNGVRVLTFGDLQYQFDQVPRPEAKTVRLSVDRDGETKEVTIPLPFEWWKTDLEFRHWSMQPRFFFESESLSDKEKSDRGLPVEGFAGRVSSIDIEAVLSGYHTLEMDDIIVGINRARIDPLTKDLEDHLVIHYPPGSEVELTVLRGGETLTIPLQTQQQHFRKAPVEVESSGVAVTWSNPEFVRRGTDKVVRYRAAFANGHLLVEAVHEPGWHSYAMDNPARGEERAGRPGGDQELPTVISLPGSLKTGGDWIQTVPVDYSKPEIHWYTWGFEGTSWFAVPLESLPEDAVSIQISSQVCDASSCAGVFDLSLSVPAPKGGQENQFVRDVLTELSPVLSGEATKSRP
ncbi:MAG: Trx7/PDZ domain-containing (seleno)protein [Verrucomicrobiales bacterium]|nr:Trx7/PDZ domain-containing (seleno)protein [Verrucomicrobiales bacterium]